ncbi:unnamed protein product, partial [Ixodes pacificus]
MTIIPGEGEQRTNTNLRTQLGNNLLLQRLSIFTTIYQYVRCLHAKGYISGVARGEAYGAFNSPSSPQKSSHLLTFPFPLCNLSHGNPS